MKNKRRISKVLALVLGFALLLGMSRPAAAEIVENPEYMDIYTIKKTFQIENEGTTTPEETFEFTIEPYMVEHSQYSLNELPVPYFSETEEGDKLYTGTITFAEGEAESLPDATKTIDLYMPQYNHVGVFTYKITETQNNTAGVVYDGRELFLKVYVVNQSEEGGQTAEQGLVRYGVLYEVGPEDEIIKVEGFINQFLATNLEINKEVTGNMGELDRYFDITVNLTAPEYLEGEGGATYKEVNSPVRIVRMDGAEEEVLVASLTFEDGKASVPLTIRHGQTIIIENLPYGVMWEVAEADYTGEGYSITINELPMFIEGNEVNFVSNLVEELADVFILNHREQDVETGVILENLPYVTIVVLVTGGLVGFVFKKRRIDLE